MIAKRYVSIISSFPAGDWVFEHPEVNLPFSGSITRNFKGLCLGDVDGSFSPEAKQEPTLWIEKGDDISVNKGETILLPFISHSAMEIGSISLRLGYSGQFLEILDVEVPGDEGNLIYHLENDQLNIAWYSLIPRQLNAGDIILQVKARVLQAGHDAIPFTVLEGSELGSPDAVSINNAKVLVPTLSPAETPGMLHEIFPNPCNDNTLITFTFPEPGYGSLVICDLLGEKMYTFQEGYFPEGNYNYRWEPGNIAKGIYFCKLIFTGRNMSNISFKPIIVVK